MIVLLTGASGFIGSHLVSALLAAGHEVVCAQRRATATLHPRVRHVAADFSRDFDERDWLPRLAGVEAVINAVGIIQETGAQTFEALHERAPRALFAACVKAGVRRVVQISALGADEQARSRYHLSKKRADDFLAALPLESVIVQPSLVFGPGGASARLFTLLAALPALPLPGGGRQQVQPIHVDDLAAALIALLARPLAPGTRLPAVGPEAQSLRGYLAALRRAMGFAPAPVVPVPMPLARLAAKAGDRLPGTLLDSETLDMLERGNTASAVAVTALLGRPPRPVAGFIDAAGARAVRREAQLGWLLPMLRLSIALVWIVTGIVSFGLYPVADSYALLARVGVPAMLAPPMLYGAAALDIAFGIGTLALRRRRMLWLAQLALIGFYTLIISWRLPEFWLHPYGPLLKNLPMMAAIWLLLELEREER